MKDKKEIVENWLPRYTGTPLDEFGEHVLLTNFGDYVAWFATQHDVSIRGADRPMPNVTADGITLINFGYVETHIRVGIEALKLVRRHGRSVKHLRIERDFDGSHDP